MHGRRPDIIILLLNKGANPNIDDNGNTIPLFSLARDRNDYEEVVAVVLAKTDLSVCKGLRSHPFERAI
jgi:ankyrin repeat protein